jgi:hypothetical protein
MIPTIRLSFLEEEEESRESKVSLGATMYFVFLFQHPFVSMDPNPSMPTWRPYRSLTLNGLMADLCSFLTKISEDSALREADNVATQDARSNTHNPTGQIFGRLYICFKHILFCRRLSLRQDSLFTRIAACLDHLVYEMVANRIP